MLLIFGGCLFSEEYGNSNSKRKHDEMLPNIIEWFKILEDVYYGQILVNDSEVTGNFKNIFNVFWDILQNSQVDTDFDGQLINESEHISSKKLKQ